MDREQRAYKAGYRAALREARALLQDSGAFNCGPHQGFEYPHELVEAMLSDLDNDEQTE